MRYGIVDSHRNMTRKDRLELSDFFCEVKGMTPEQAASQIAFCDWFEHEYAVKWFEVVAKDAGAVVGYLRCLRDPKDVRRWLISDVHVRNAYRRKGIATRLYQRVFKTLCEYEAAEETVAAVRKDNEKSIRLHEKLGFHDTNEPCEFADFFVVEDETMFRKFVYRYLPVPNIDGAVNRIYPLWEEWKKREKDFRGKEAETKHLSKLISEAEKGNGSVEGIWCGNRLVGLRTETDGRTAVYNQQEAEN